MKCPHCNNGTIYNANGWGGLNSQEPCQDCNGTGQARNPWHTFCMSWFWLALRIEWDYRTSGPTFTAFGRSF